MMNSFKKVATLVGLFIGLVSQIISLIQALRNNFTITSSVLLGTGFCITVVALITVVWSRVPSTLGNSSERLPRYSKRARRLAGLALVCLPLVLASGFGGWKYYRGTPKGKFIILVTDFSGPDPKSFRFSDIIVEEIRRKTSTYPDIETRSVARAITAQEGSVEARKLAEEYDAAIVLWGWYGATSDRAAATIHFEIMRPRELSRIPSSKFVTPPVAELNSFVMQARVARDYSYISLITAALSRYEQKDYPGAIERFNAAEESAGEDTSLLDPVYLYFHRGSAYIWVGKQDLAITDLNRCIARRPDFAAAYINRAVALHDKGQYVEAKADADSGIRLDASEAIGYNTRGVILKEMGENLAALQDFDKALEINPQLSWAYNNRGLVYDNLGDTDRALEDYDRAIEYGSTLAFNNRAMTRYHAGEYQLAIDDFTKALNHDRTDPFTYAYRGLAYAALGEASPATADCERAVQMSPNDAEIYDVKGIASTLLRDFDGATQDFETALRLNPKFPRTYFDRATMHMRLERYELAIKDFSSAIKLRPSFADAYLGRAEAYKKLGKQQLASKDLASASDYGRRFVVTSIEPIGKKGEPGPRPREP